MTAVDRSTPLDWATIVDIEAGIANCKLCRDRSAGERVSPQPSWIGRDYAPGGVAFVLQNPVAPPDRDAWARRDDSLTFLLQQFRDAPTAPQYHQLVAEVHAQMLGRDDRSTEAWETWTELVGRCVEGCLEPTHLAWMNVAKYRRPRRQNLLGEERKHGVHHLREELRVLQPRLVVTAGREARMAAHRIEGEWAEPLHVPLLNPQPSQTLEVLGRIQRERLCRREPRGKKARKRASRSNRIGR